MSRAGKRRAAEESVVVKAKRASVSAVHASRSPKQAAAIADKIAQTLKNKSPEDRQRLSGGNFARGLMKRSGIDVHHLIIRPRVDALIARTEFDGQDETMTKFRTRCERLISKGLR